MTNQTEPDYKSTEYRIGVMQAFLQGQTIQSLTYYQNAEWVDTVPEWNFVHYRYRVKPAPPSSLYSLPHLLSLFQRHRQRCEGA